MTKEHRLVTTDILIALETEDQYCQTKWAAGTPNGRPYDERSIDEWLLYMDDYLTEARHQSVRGDENAALHTIRKVVSMGVTCMRKHGAPLRITDEEMPSW